MEDFGTDRSLHKPTVSRRHGKTSVRRKLEDVNSHEYLSDVYNVAALLVIGGYLMRFFPLFKPGPKNDRLK